MFSLALPEGGIVRSIGTDLVECDRMAKILERQGERFLRKVYTETERAYCMSMRNPVPSLAARFAAKEAVAKCFTTGIGAELGWHSIEVVKGPREQPLIRLDAAAHELLHQLGGTDVLISLTHTQNDGLAMAAIVSSINRSQA